MPDIWLTLHMHLAANAVEGPGWYIAGARDGGVPLIPPVRISAQQAAEVGALFERLLPTKVELPPSQIVESGNSLIRQAIQAQLEEAEAQALRVAKLRKLLAAETATVETQPYEKENAQ